MKPRVRIITWLLIVLSIIVVLSILKPISPSKPRASRIHAVNNIASTFPKTITLTNVSTPLTNAP